MPKEVLIKKHREKKYAINRQLTIKTIRKKVQPYKILSQSKILLILTTIIYDNLFKLPVNLN